MRHKKEPIVVFQPPLVAIFVDSPSCPLKTETGLRPIVHRIERWTMKVNIRPIETKVAFRVITSSDVKKMTIDLSSCGHPDGCSIAGGPTVPGDVDGNDVGSTNPRRRSLLIEFHGNPPFSRPSSSARRISSEYSFADDASVVSADNGHGVTGIDRGSVCEGNASNAA